MEKKIIKYPQWYILDNVNILDIKPIKKGKGKRKKPSYGLYENMARENVSDE